MALFNNYSFNIGFLCGISNWLVPRFPFVPVWGGFSVWNNCGCGMPLPPPPPMPVINFNASFGKYCKKSVFTPTQIGTTFNLNASMPSVWNSNCAQNYNCMPNFNLQTFPVMNNWQTPNWGNFRFPTWGTCGVKQAKNNLSCKFTVSGNNIIPEGYNKEKGEKLANTAWKRKIGITHQCAQYVREAIELSNLGVYGRANGWKFHEVLDKNPNFKEIAVPAEYNKLPPGCIALFKPGSQGYHKQHGHVEITVGDGRTVFDGVNNHMKKPDKVYIPV